MELSILYQRRNPELLLPGAACSWFEILRGPTHTLEAIKLQSELMTRKVSGKPVIVYKLEGDQLENYE